MRFSRVFILFFLFTSSSIYAQFTSAQIGVDGLTCSQCTRSVELKIKQLPFVDSVKMDLSNTKGLIIFKPNASVNIYAIAKAVIDAGFSLRYLTIAYNFSNQTISPAYSFSAEQRQFQYIGTEIKTLNGVQEIKIIGELFLSRKDFKKWKNKVKPQKADTIYYFTV